MKSMDSVLLWMIVIFLLYQEFNDIPQEKTKSIMVDIARDEITDFGCVKESDLTEYKDRVQEVIYSLSDSISKNGSSLDELETDLSSKISEVEMNLEDKVDR